MIYFNISETSRRLQISREISETARQITERISQDIRKNGVFIGTKETDTQWNDNSTANYLGDGNNVLHIRKVNPDGSQAVSHTYYYGKIDWWIQACSDDDKNNTEKYCGLVYYDGTTQYDLVDSFRSEQESKRVKITDLKFYVTGGDQDANKVTLKMTLELTARAGVPPSLIRSTKMEVQTTFSERPYTIN